MRVVTFASGSSGNCTLVSLGRAHFLIDAGISWRRIREQLSLSGVKPEALSAVLITHEHTDHISGLATMSRRCDAPVLAPRTVANRLRGKIPDVAERLREFPVGQRVEIDGVTVLAFHTPHDTDESVGWRLEADEGCFALATDMGEVTPEIREGLAGADCALIEANHDPELLRYGPYPYALKRRILSTHGHLSNPECAALAVFLAENGTRDLILGHLSRENNVPALAWQTVAEALRERALAFDAEAEAAADTEPEADTELEANAEAAAYPNTAGRADLPDMPDIPDTPDIPDRSYTPDRADKPGRSYRPDRINPDRIEQPDRPAPTGHHAGEDLGGVRLFVAPAAGRLTVETGNAEILVYQ